MPSIKCPLIKKRPFRVHTLWLPQVSFDELQIGLKKLFPDIMPGEASALYALINNQHKDGKAPSFNPGNPGDPREVSAQSPHGIAMGARVPDLKRPPEGVIGWDLPREEEDPLDWWRYW